MNLFQYMDAHGFMAFLIITGAVYLGLVIITAVDNAIVNTFKVLLAWIDRKKDGQP